MLHPDQIKKIFYEVYNGEKNFMTPSIIKYGKAGRFVFELSTGRGLGDGAIYGVTVLEKTGGVYEKRHDMNQCFSSREEANDYIKTELKGN